MANEKRLIDANAPWIKRHFTKRLVDVFALVENIEDITWYHVNEAGRLTEGANSNRDIPLFKANDIFSALGSAPTVDAVEVVQFNALKSLVNGEWVDCKLVQEALGIDFATGLKMFDFSRTAEWNPAPLNGQKITTKFRLKNAVVHGRWVDNGIPDSMLSGCSVCGFTCGAYSFNYCPNCGAKMDGDGNG